MSEQFDLIAIGSGPAGREAALAAAQAGKRALVVEYERGIGGACVRYGTIPSKTLRETAMVLAGLRSKAPGLVNAEVAEDVKLAALMRRLHDVVDAHETTMTEQLAKMGVVRWHGRASFVSRTELEVLGRRGERRSVRAPTIVIATGSRPRTPEGVPVDHEHVMDSDSILSMGYLPRSMAVLGGGVIASEYASIFAALGVSVTMIDRGERPLGFIDAELVERFQSTLAAAGARWCGGTTVRSMTTSALGHVRLELGSGETIEADKVLCALGRVANVEKLNLAAAGLEVNARGHIAVGPHCNTVVPGIYAVGDVAGPPSLAAAGAEQGRRAARHALGLAEEAEDLIPTGVYTIPEIASVGLTEAQARETHGEILVGRASFAETTRGMIAGAEDGMLKLVADARGERLLGVHAVGESASELVSVGQVAMMAGFGVDRFVRAIFNFPTFVEAYRVAAIDLRMRRPQKTLAPARKTVAPAPRPSLAPELVLALVKA